MQPSQCCFILQIGSLLSENDVTQDYYVNSVNGIKEIVNICYEKYVKTNWMKDGEYKELGGWFSIREFSNTLITNGFALSTFIVHFNNKYTLIFRKTHSNTLRTRSILHRLHRLLSLWLTAYVRGDCSRHAGLLLFCYSTQFSIFVTYDCLGCIIHESPCVCVYWWMTTIHRKM